MVKKIIHVHVQSGTSGLFMVPVATLERASGGYPRHYGSTDSRVAPIWIDVIDTAIKSKRYAPDMLQDVTSEENFKASLTLLLVSVVPVSVKHDSSPPPTVAVVVVTDPGELEQISMPSILTDEISGGHGGLQDWKL